MDSYRIPRREVPVRILLDDGRNLDGVLFTAEATPGARPEGLLRHLNDASEEFLPLRCGDDSFLLNKAGIVWVVISGPHAAEVASEDGSGRAAPVRLSLTGGLGVVGTLSILMPPERNRVLDYLNAAGRFIPVLGEGIVTLVQRGFVVSVRSS